MSAKALRIRFDKIDGFIKIQSGIIYLEIFDYWFMIKFIIRLDISQVEKVILQIASIIILKKSEFSYNSSPIEKIFTFHNVIIPIKSVVNKNKMNTTVIYFQEKVHIKINPKRDISK